MHKIELDDAPVAVDEAGLRVAFPLSSATGTASTAVVWITLEPGAELAEHVDSAEELLFCVEGSVEASLGDETGTLEAGEIALVPAMAPHGIRNTSGKVARVVGFFSASTNVATFTEPMGPGGPQVVVIGAPIPLAAPLETAPALA